VERTHPVPVAQEALPLEVLRRQALAPRHLRRANDRGGVAEAPVMAMGMATILMMTMMAGQRRKEEEISLIASHNVDSSARYQRHPDKYTKAACRGSGFVDMAKLKDHIKRVHTQPLRCSRCWLDMESEDAYSEHLQQESICGKATEPLEDRIRPQLLKRLEFKKTPYSNAHSVEEKWKMLYKVLFPSDDTVPSPCKCDH
jgi:hypothetical protein